MSYYSAKASYNIYTTLVATTEKSKTIHLSKQIKMRLNLLFHFIILTQLLSAQTFTEVTGTPFDGVDWSSVAFSDVDSDGDNDLLITGDTSSERIADNTSFERIAKLYTNDGGSFTEVTGTPFEGVDASSVAFSDVDGDGDYDQLITGWNGSRSIAKLYTNDGSLTTNDHVNNVFEFDFTTYPNPTNSNTLNIIYDSRAYKMVNLSLYDLNGRLLSKQQESSKIGAQTFSMDIASLPQGEYIIELDDGKRKGVAKFMVQ